MSTEQQDTDRSGPQDTSGLSPENLALMGAASNEHVPTDPCLAAHPEHGEDCQAEAGHDGDHTNFWEVWAR